MGIDNKNHLDNNPPLDPRIESLAQGPITFEATGDRQYPVIEGLGEVIDFGEVAEQQALAYARGVMPETSLDLLSSEGSTALILEDGTGLAFKLMRGNGYYSYTEDEAAGMTLMSNVGLAPKMHLLLDAHEDFRTDLIGTTPKREFGDVIIPRQEVQGNLPMIVMDKVAAASITTMPLDRVRGEFKRVVTILSENGIAVLGDVEIVHDTATGAATFIDLGGLYRVPNVAAWKDVPNEITHIIQPTFRRFAGGNRYGLGDKEIQAIINTNGLEGLAQRLVEARIEHDSSMPPA